MPESIIELVAKLKELEAKDHEALPLRLDDNGYLWDNQLSQLDTLTPCDSNMLLIDLRNAAPLLLDVLSMIRAGDADRFKDLIRILDNAWWIDMEMTDMLHRYRDMAAKMEAER